MALYHSFPFLSIFSSRVFSFLGFLCLVCVVPTSKPPERVSRCMRQEFSARKILQNNLRKTHDKNTCRAQEPSRFRQHLHLRNTSTIVNLGLRAQVATVEVVVDECREYLRRRERRRERRRLRWRLERMMERRM